MAKGKETDVQDLKRNESVSQETLEAQLTEALTQVESLKKQLLNRTLDLSRDCVVYKGQILEIEDVDRAWEIGQKVEKGYVDEDRACFVVKGLTA